MKREMGHLKSQYQETAAPAVREEPTAPIEAAVPTAVPAKQPEVAKESLSYNDIEILRALAEDNYVFGNLVGLTDKTGLARDVVSNRLTVLKNLGIIETRINDRGVLHWYVAPKGRQMLGEILSGQEDR